MQDAAYDIDLTQPDIDDLEKEPTCGRSAGAPHP